MSSSLTLETALKRTQTVELTVCTKNPTPKYLGSRFAVLNTPDASAPFETLVFCLSELIGTCTDSNKALLATKCINSLGHIYKKQHPQDQEKITSITNIVLTSLGIFNKRLSTREYALELQSYLSIMITGKEEIILNYQETCLAQDQIAATKKRAQLFELVFAAGDKRCFKLPDLTPLFSSTEGVGFICRWFFIFKYWKNYGYASTFSEKNFSEQELEELRNYQLHHQNEIQNIARKICTFMDLNRSITVYNEACSRKTDFYNLLAQDPSFLKASQVGIFFKKYYPPYLALELHTTSFYDRSLQEMENGTFVDTGSDSQEAADRLKICQTFFGSAETLNFIYEYFYTQLASLENLSIDKQLFWSTFGKPIYPSSFCTNIFVSPEVFRTILPPNLKPEIVDEKKEEKKIEDTTPQAKTEKGKKEEKDENKVKKPNSSKTCPLSTLLAQRTSLPFADYDKRSVEAWFNPKLNVTTIPKYANLVGYPQVQEKVKWCHAFTKIVDQFLGTPYSITGSRVHPTKNIPHTLYVIAAEVTYKGVTIRGVFQFCVDEDNICYHRCFGEKSNGELLDNIISNQLIDKIDFPSLGDSFRATKAGKPLSQQIEGIEVTLDPGFNTVSFLDGERLIKLFKFGK